MASTDTKKKEYDYDRILISLENCILPSEKLDETPSMKDGLDRDTENDLRSFACEIIQVAGILLKVPQVSLCIPILSFQSIFIDLFLYVVIITFALSRLFGLVAEI